MNAYIIYTTQGTTYGPNLNVDVENCQVLGIIQSNTEKDAIQKLFEKNEWIQRAGFTKDYVVATQLFTSSNKKDINEIINYLLNEEHIHFQENNYPKNHIFRILKRLKESL
ncbi:MAG: hypothetical protein K2G11_08160 [Muribaculaceae bacterium]|nr:hypothetical protein [Bacteroidales bacterium]MDE6084449.1 hypothetical protein [Muribaculaceae bacterium]